MYGHKQCQFMNTNDKVTMINNKDSEYLLKLNPCILYGTFIKDELFINDDGATRSRPKPFVFKMENIGSEMANLSDLFESKYLQTIN